MGNSGSQSSCGGEFFDFQHAPLYLELLHLAQGREVAQDSNGVCNLATLTIDLAGAGVIIDILPQRGIVQTQRRGFAISEGRGKRVDKRRKLGLVLELDGV